MEDPFLQVCCLVLLPAASAHSQPPRLARLLMSAVLRLELLILRRYPAHLNHFAHDDLRALVPRTIEASQIDDIRSMQLDILVRCGGTNPEQTIAGAARHGLITSTAAEGDSGDTPAGFWEVMAKQGLSWFSIVHFQPGVAARVLRRVSIGTKYFHLLNRAELESSQSAHLLLLLKQLCAHGELPPAQDRFPASGRVRTHPSTAQTLSYGASLGRILLEKALDRLRGQRLRWNVAFAHSGWRELTMSAATVIDNPKGHFLADPFVVAQNGRHCCFVEDYDDAAQKGAIAVYEIEDGKATRLGEALNEPFHLSFPFVFTYQGALYMCPETGEAGEIRLYRNVEFPLRWELDRVLMRDVRAVDTVLFPKDGKWWMLTNIKLAATGDYCSELFVFSANSPLSTQWAAHSANPVCSDANGARNGGLLADGARVYRPGQCQGFDLYGKHIGIHEIKTLTPDLYCEVRVAELHPDFFAGISGTHHIHSNGEFTVFDFVKKMRR